MTLRYCRSAAALRQCCCGSGVTGGGWHRSPRFFCCCRRSWYNGTMAKTEYVDILPELEEDFFTGIQSSDRFVHSRLVKKIALFSRKKKAGLKVRSLLPAIAEIWAGFSEAEKTAWSNAGAEMGLNGWRLFVQDQTIRILNDMAGVATPSLLHQSWIGNLKIEAPASELKIVQLHPKFYWISKKVTGKKGMYEPVLITEDLALPVKISLNYSSNLVETAPGSFAKFYARFWHSYQGADQYTDLEIPLDYFSGWKYAEATLTELAGYVIRYDLYFHLKNLTGDLYFDNVEAEHSAQNWVRDPFCKDILQGFTRAFYQIPKHWAGVILPEGAIYDSIYKDF